MSMRLICLLAFKKYNIGFQEESIETVYIEDNSSSHFNPVKDSIKIYKVIFKYLFKSTGMKYVGSSIASWAIDNIIFNVLEFVLIGLTVSLRIFISTAAARVLSSVLISRLTEMQYLNHSPVLNRRW